MTEPAHCAGVRASTWSISAAGSRKIASGRPDNSPSHTPLTVTAMAETRIEWATHVWNPTTGCDRVSEGCDNCYALALAKRLKAMGQPKYQHDGDPRTSGPGFQLTCHEDAIDQPLSWRKPRLVFVNSMSDLFHPDVPDAFIRRVFDVMAEATRHTFQVLTKRPQRMATVLASWESAGWQPAQNVWLGCSIEDDRYTFRARHLKDVPAVIRFLSVEPLLGPVPSLDLAGIDWLIAGGESGPRHRPVQPAWVRALRDACCIADVPFFFKQWGGRTAKSQGRELDGVTWSGLPSGTRPELTQALLS